MTSPEEKAAYINSQVASAAIEALGMEAENKQREIQGESMAYVHKDFIALLTQYGLHHNDVVSYFHD